MTATIETGRPAIDDRNRFAARASANALARAAAAGPDALLAYAQRVDARYRYRAAATWSDYALIYTPGCRYSQGVEIPGDDDRWYLQAQNSRGETVCMCGAQSHVEAVNDALRAARIAYRISCKHRHILLRLEQANREAGVCNYVPDESRGDLFDCAACYDTGRAFYPDGTSDVCPVCCTAELEVAR